MLIALHLYGIRAVKIRFVKGFWNATSIEFAKKIARDKLEEVFNINFVEVLVFCRCLFLDSYQLVSCSFRRFRRRRTLRLQ
jgi:hypothetical protein